MRLRRLSRNSASAPCSRPDCTRTTSRPRCRAAAAAAILPVADPLAQQLDIARGEQAGLPRFRVVRLDPAGRHRGQLEGEGAVDHHEEHVVQHVQRRELLDESFRRIDEKVRHDRHERALAKQAGQISVPLRSTRAARVRQAVLIDVHAVHGVIPARARPRGQPPPAAVHRDEPDQVLAEGRGQPQGGHRAGDHLGDRRAGDAALRRTRRVGDDDDRRGALLLELAGDQRAEVGEARLRPVDRGGPVAGLPVAQSDQIEARAVEDAVVRARRVLAHPAQHDQLDVLDLLPAHQPLRDGRRHGMGTRSTMSSITVSTRTPWLAACGASHTRWPRM